MGGNAVPDRRPPDVRGIVGADVARQQEPVAPDAGVDRDVLLAVRSAERNRRAHDTRTDFELPQLAASLRIGGLEPAVQCAEEYDVVAPMYGVPGIRVTCAASKFMQRLFVAV